MSFDCEEGDQILSFNSRHGEKSQPEWHEAMFLGLFAMAERTYFKYPIQLHPF
jgi:hypothetical protein